MENHLHQVFQCSLILLIVNPNNNVIVRDIRFNFCYDNPSLRLILDGRPNILNRIAMTPSLVLRLKEIWKHILKPSW